MINQSSLTQDFSLIRALLEKNTIGIVIGDKFNLDTVGAGLSLYLSLKKAGKNAQIISKREPSVEISNLVGIDKLKRSFSGSSNKLVVSLPYVRGEIGKVSYKEEQDRINFYLTAVEGRSITPYEQNDINLIWEGASPQAIVVIGASNASVVREFADVAQDSVKVITIDTTGEQFGDVSLVDPSLSSTSEIITKLLRDLRLPMDIDISQNLLDGILYATRNFTKPNTSPFAFESAGTLMQMGAKRGDNRNVGKGNLFMRDRDDNRNRNKNQSNFDVRENNPNRQSDNDQKIESAALPHDTLEEAESSPESKPTNDNAIPNDWLMPKVFKGSQNIDDLK